MLTVDAVAARLELPASLVLRFIGSGLLAAYQIGPGVFRVTPAELGRFLGAHPWLHAIVR